MVKVYCSTVLEAPIEATWDMLRDFNGHDQWHPAIASSQIEHGHGSDQVGCVRRFRLGDGSELRERLLTLSDMETAFSYCLFDTPVPLLNYVAHVRLSPVTDGDWTFWEWESKFDTPAGQEDDLRKLVCEDIYQAGFDAIRAEMGLEVA
ncbi:SRPBCC family protein [uncultured Tateyamaria sp.]|uniref:SRPBCC family protein n=1 Tax=uncultured Tateyamaria sp. TaxID=455651 RepID=UPI002623E0E7|nr:SRPBCC family protein [uncultured Tateyamaria sp.]